MQERNCFAQATQHAAQGDLSADPDDMFDWLNRFLCGTFGGSRCFVAIRHLHDNTAAIVSPSGSSDVELATWLKFLNGQSESPHRLRKTMMLDAYRLMTVMLVRPPTETPFTLEDRALLDKMLPLVGGMLLLRDRTGAGNERWRAMLDALNRLTIGVMLVNSHGTVLAMNHSAETIVRSAATKTDGKDDPDTLLIRRLMERAALSHAKQGTAAPPATLTLPRDPGSPVTVLFSQLAGPGPASSDGPLTALFLCDPDHSLAEHEESLRTLYGLTRLEARIVIGLVDGLSIEECAQQLRISVHTIRAYLKQIFSKTGAHRQASLIRLVMASLGGLRAPGKDSPAGAPRNGTKSCSRPVATRSALVAVERTQV